MEENILKTQDDEVLVLEVSSEDEARDRAASRWNIAREDVLLTVVGEEKKLFGLFGRKRPKRTADLSFCLKES